jgi:AcrR family transcriptional regulator
MDQPETTTAARPYHHGDLKTALLNEAQAILERDGIQALTLRAAARAAGVSHAAPANHFGDLTGLLSELAAVGFTRFSAMLATARATGAGWPSGARAMGHAYVAFARSHPNLFLLMFRGERLDTARPALRDAMDAASRALRSASGAPDANLSPLQIAARAAARWSLVHGFAMLLLDGRLKAMIGSLPPAEDADDLLDAVLDMTRFDG